MGSGEEHILVVDDQDLLRDLLTEFLTGHGYRVSTVPSGEEALDRIASEKIDMVLLDVLMPGMGGMEVLKQLRTRHSASELPIIMVTGQSDREDIVSALQLEANDYITKPLDMPVALARIRTHLALKSSVEAFSRHDEKMRKELDLARTIHRALLPAGLPHLPGFDFGLFYAPSGELSGDYFNFLPLGANGKLGIVFADLTGHGVPAALLATMFKVLSDEAFGPDTSPSNSFQNLNRRVVDEFPEGNFASTFYMVLDAQSRAMTYVKAAQEPAILIKANGDVQILEHGGPALGLVNPDVYEEPSYEERTVSLAEGDTIFLYTDGIVELSDAEGKLLERDDLVKWVVDDIAQPPQELAESIYTRAVRFTGQAEFEDDVAILVVRVA